MGWAEHATACMEELRNSYKILAGKPEGIDGRIIL
jgi:hypothetical protein